MSVCLTVSHRRENTVLRACISPEIAHVIPNAIVAERFKPLTSNSHREDDTSKLNYLQFHKLYFNALLQLLSWLSLVSRTGKVWTS